MRKKERVMLKIHFEKTCDHVDWAFVLRSCGVRGRERLWFYDRGGALEFSLAREV